MGNKIFYEEPQMEVLEFTTIPFTLLSGNNTGGDEIQMEWDW